MKFINLSDIECNTSEKGNMHFTIVHFKRLGSRVSHDSFNQYVFFFSKTMYILQNKCNILLFLQLTPFLFFQLRTSEVTWRGKTYPVPTWGSLSFDH